MWQRTGWPVAQLMRCEIAKKRLYCGTEDDRADWSLQGDENATEQSRPIVAETGEQVPARPHNTGIQTKLLMAWTPRPSRCGALQKTRLLLPRRMISKKHRYLTGQAKRRKI
jgi:hypothetical protein